MMAKRQTQASRETRAIGSRSVMEITPPTQPQSTAERSSQDAGNGAIPDEIRTRIEKLAYELYQRRGGQDGHDWQDWLEAERLTLTPSALGSQDSSRRLSASYLDHA